MQNTKLRTSSALEGDVSETPISEKTQGPLLAVNNMSYRNPANKESYRTVVDEMYGTNNTPTSPSVLAGIREEISVDTPRLTGAIFHKPNTNAGSRIADIKEYYDVDSVPAADISVMTDDEIIERIVNFDTVWVRSLSVVDDKLFFKRAFETQYFQSAENKRLLDKFIASLLLSKAAQEQGRSATTYEEASERIRAEAEAKVPTKSEKTLKQNP